MASATVISIFIIAIIVLIIIFIYVFFISKRISTTSATGQTFNQCRAPPTTPSNVSVFMLTNTSITVTWSAVTGADTYRTYISKTSGFSLVDSLSVKSTGNTTVTFTGLDTGFIYYVKVTAFNSCGESLPSPQISISLPYVYPSKFVIQNKYDTVVQVSLNPSLGVNSYRNFLTSVCSPVNCGYVYNDIDSTVRLQSDQTRCLTAVSGSEVWTIPCTSSSLISRQWSYDAKDNSLCLSSNPTGSCLHTPPGFSNPAGFGQFATLETKTPNVNSSWLLVPI